MNARWSIALKEYGAGLAGGVLIGGAVYLFGNTVLRWTALAVGGWAIDLSSLIAILLFAAAAAVGSGEPIYRLARRERPEWGKRARRQIWKGGFLGPTAVIAVLQVMELDWRAVAEPALNEGFLWRALKLFLAGFQYLITAPLRLIVYGLDIPAEIPIVLAMPVGALLVRYFGHPENMLDATPTANEETPDDAASQQS